MSTDRQRAANRRNSQLSTGPRTLRGRAAVAANPLIHGFYARVAVPDLEDPAAYHAVLADYIADFRPAGALEAELVHRYVKDLWKLRRLEQMERMFFIDSIERNEPRVAAHITDPAQRASRACFDAIETQFIQFKTLAPLERIALLGHRLRRSLDSTLRLLCDLQAQRFASADPGEPPFAELATLPPNTLAYTRDPADVPDHSAALPSPAPRATDPLVPEPPATAPRPSDGAATERSGRVVTDPQPSDGAANERSGFSDPPVPDPPCAPSTPPNSPQTPPASPTIHTPNHEIGFVPSKITSIPPRGPSEPRSKRSSNHPVHPRP